MTAMSADVIRLLDRHLKDASHFSGLVNLADKYCRCCCKAKSPSLDALLKFAIGKIQENPFRYSDLFVIVEAVIGCMIEQNNSSFLKENLGFFMGLCSESLNGKWQESEFLSHCLKLLSTIYTASRTELLAQPTFLVISEKLLTIFLEYNSYEARRDIIKFW